MDDLENGRFRSRRDDRDALAPARGETGSSPAAGYPHDHVKPQRSGCVHEPATDGRLVAEHAAEPFARSGMSDAARENAEWLLDAIWKEFQSAVVSDRDLDPAAFEAAVSQGTLQPAEAVAARLVDGVRQREDVRQSLGDTEGSERIVDVSSYRKLPDGGPRGAPKIAVVHARGFILGSRNGYNPVTGTHRFSLLRGLVSTIFSVSPILHLLFSSCALNFVTRFIVFLYTGF